MQLPSTTLATHQWYVYYKIDASARDILVPQLKQMQERLCTDFTFLQARLCERVDSSAPSDPALTITLMETYQGPDTSAMSDWRHQLETEAQRLLFNHLQGLRHWEEFVPCV